MKKGTGLKKKAAAAHFVEILSQGRVLGQIVTLYYYLDKFGGNGR
jgi:hypothetical protein